MKKVLAIVIAVVVLGAGLWVYMRYFYIFGEGVKAGTLNYVVRKGYLFKTYEGEMILTGFQTKGVATMASNEFLFSISNPVLARKLMLNSGKLMQLHYNEYNGAVAWRGYSKFIVDSVVSIESPAQPAAPGK
ncbi:MAG TPA: hypothetical protein VGR89_15810 [Puia sp.]|nr:hypothetical protein [Puia sp.]